MNHRLDPTLDFMRLLWSIEHGLQKQSKRMKTEIGITGPQRLVLRIVAQYPGLSAGTLAGVIQLHPSTVTGILQRLEGRKLLKRERDPEDSRRIRLWPTARASRHTATSVATVEHRVRNVLRRARASDLTAARRVLAELADRLNDR